MKFTVEDHSTRLMLRFVMAGVLLALPAAAQQADDAWKKPFTQGVYDAGQKDYAKAEQNLLAALHEAERFGDKDVRVASTENTLGLVYAVENKFGEAEKAYRTALAIFETVSGKESLDVANVNFNIASVMFSQGHQADAMPHIRQALQTYEGQLGGNSVKTAAALCMQGDAYRAMKDFAAAEGPLRRCADIREADGGVENPELADAVYSLAMAYVGQGKYALAEPRFKLAEKIRENTLGLTSPLLAQTLEDHAALLKSMGRDKEAEKLTTLAAAIRRNQKKK